MNIEKAELITGGLSAPSKMPCFSYNLPNTCCKTGHVLKGVNGSVCNKCYASRGNYRFSCVKKATQKRFEAINNRQWVSAMSYLIMSKGCGYFRWHDSGDLQDEKHLENIIKVCKNTPSVIHWLPTKEKDLVNSFYNKIKKIENLTVRVSMFMINELPEINDKIIKSGKVFSSVAKQEVINKIRSNKRFVCPYKEYNNTCGPCRKCWDKATFNIVYKYH